MMVEVGDIVKVVDPRRCYPTYEKWIRQHASEYWSKFKYGDFLSGSPKRFLLGKVVAVAEHYSKEQGILAGVLIEDQLFPINVEGLEVVEKAYTTGQIIDMLKPGMKAIGRNPECHVWDGVEIYAVDADEDGRYAIRCKSPLPQDFGREKSLPLCGQVMALKWELLPKEVTWQEALQAWIDGKHVKHVPAKDEECFSEEVYHSNRTIMNLDRLRAGKWYILDGEE